MWLMRRYLYDVVSMPCGECRVLKERSKTEKDSPVSIKGLPLFVRQQTPSNSYTVRLSPDEEDYL